MILAIAHVSHPLASVLVQELQVGDSADALQDGDAAELKYTGWVLSGGQLAQVNTGNRFGIVTIYSIICFLLPKCIVEAFVLLREKSPTDWFSRFNSFNMLEVFKVIVTFQGCSETVLSVFVNQAVLHFLALSFIW